MCLIYDVPVYTRGFTEEDFVKVVEYFDRSVKIAIEIKSKTGNKLKDFKAALETGPASYPELAKLGEEVKAFASSFPTVGF